MHITNTSNLPVESIEMEYPLLVESYGFVADSGGAGKYRGGLGLRRVVRPVGHTMTFSGQGERFVNRPWGLFGGGSGGTGKFVKLAGGAEVPLPTKPANLEVKPDEAIVVETPGAGGYGKPAERDARRGRERFRVGQVQRATSSSSTTAWSRRSDELRRDRRRRGHQRRRDRLSSCARPARRRCCSSAASRRAAAPARAPRSSARAIRRRCWCAWRAPASRCSRTRRPSSARTRASCRTATASSSRTTCWRARRRTSRCRRASASSTNGREGAGLSAASARDQSRRHRRHRLRAAWRLRRSGAGDRGLCRRVQKARRRIPRPHAGAAAAARRAIASPASSSTAARSSAEHRGQRRRPVGEAARRKRRPRPADARGARAGHGVAGAGGPRGAEDLGLDGRRCDCYYRPLGQGRFIIGRGFPKEYFDVDPYNYKTSADDDFIARRPDARRAPLSRPSPA